MKRIFFAILFFVLSASLIGIADVKPITFSGEGCNRTRTFHLKQGKTNFKLTTEKDNIITASLKRVDGKAKYPLNNGERLAPDVIYSIHISRSGNFYLDVKSHGKWTITITQPKPKYKNK